MCLHHDSDSFIFRGAERAVTEREFPQLEGRPVGAFPFRTGIVANVKVGLGKYKNADIIKS